jgi:hypothetical protein
MHFSGAPDLTVSLRGSSTAGTGPDLAGYPHLTYAPAQWGDGVRIARNGAEVDSITDDAAPTVLMLDRLAAAERITWDELFDALRYARANGAI